MLITSPNAYGCCADVSALAETIKKMVEQNRELQRKAAELEEKLSRQSIKDILESRIKTVDGIKYLAIVQEDSTNYAEG